jgi:hypothetical protein
MKKPSFDKTFFPEVLFIVCRRRRNQPQVSPLICEKRCRQVKGCQEYFDYVQPAMFERYEKREAKEKSSLNPILGEEDS